MQFYSKSSLFEENNLLQYRKDLLQKRNERALPQCKVGLSVQYGIVCVAKKVNASFLRRP